MFASDQVIRRVRWSRSFAVRARMRSQFSDLAVVGAAMSENGQTRPVATLIMRS